ncbi:MAG: hypothetical protein U0269_33785 [Polyangiales bacterium]
MPPTAAQLSSPTFLSTALLLGALGCGARVHPGRPEPNIAQVSVGTEFACVRLSTGRVRCFGNNTHGTLGDGTTEHRTRPVDVLGLASVTSLSSSATHSCAVSRGAVFCWGGLRLDAPSQPTPAPVANISNAVEVATLFDGACARLANGAVRCWGDNSAGQLGDGTRERREGPVDVVGIPPATRVFSSPWRAACIVAVDASVWCWGSYGNNSTLRPERIRNLSSAREVSASPHAFCANTGRDIRCWGQFASAAPSFDAIVVVDRPDAIAIAVVNGRFGNQGLCARWVDPALECWSVDSLGRIGDASVNRAFPDPEELAMGAWTYCSVTHGGGSLYCSGPAVVELLGGDAGAADSNSVRRIDGIL